MLGDPARGLWDTDLVSHFLACGRRGHACIGVPAWTVVMAMLPEVRPLHLTGASLLGFASRQEGGGSRSASLVQGCVQGVRRGVAPPHWPRLHLLLPKQISTLTSRCN